MALKSPISPIPDVLEFRHSTATKEDVIKALKVSGGVFIRGLLSPAQVEQIERDVRPWLEKDKPWNGWTFLYF
jgi:hypothetical protein